MAQFREINPKKFEVGIADADSLNDVLVLAERFDPNWKAYLVFKDGQEREIRDHVLARGYANGWQISGEDLKNGRPDHVLVEYYPIRLMWRGICISVATALFLIGYLLKYYYVTKNKRICQVADSQTDV